MATSLRFGAIFSLVIVFLANIGFSADISSCGSIAEDSVLTQDLAANGTCLSIAADDVTLDCAGHSIIGNGDGTGILDDGYENVGVKNCQISNFTTPIYFTNGATNAVLYNLNLYNYSSTGIFLDYSNNASIYFVSANSSAHGIWLSHSDYSMISNSTSNAIGSSKYGIYLLSSARNEIINSTGSAPVGYGIYLYSSSYNNIINSTGISPSSSAIELQAGSAHNNVINSTGIGSAGIRFNAPYNNLINSTGNSPAGNAISLMNDYNTVLNSTGISTSSGSGMFVRKASDNLLVNNMLSVDENTYAIAITGGSTNNTVTDLPACMP